jgi:hypothetical protein
MRRNYACITVKPHTNKSRNHIHYMRSDTRTNMHMLIKHTYTQREGDVNIRSKKCMHPYCTKTPSFGDAVEHVARYCRQHKQSDHVDVRSKRCLKCTRRASRAKDGCVMYVCMHVYMDSCVHIQTYVPVHVLCECVCLKYMYVYVCMHLYVYVCTHTYIHTYMHTYMHTHTHMHIACMCVLLA